ncbi:hypothetical protein [Marinobacter vinifirmus]|uniref:Uncharacterized protein n=1 Tax=Marinobacter vinifirmus TaxID=355591 RepID=A0A558B2Z6_9GAMM|nr:hypothetical protein [Marinobacter vinifirmus]TVT30877.1 MAG: hypothetical protein FHK81_16165 [Marinobacter vinifirmus]
MQCIFQGDDLTVYQNVFFDGANQGGIAAVCFSAWTSAAEGKRFGEGFFSRNKIPAFFIVQRSNHWWHTSEIWSALDCIRSILLDKGLGSICYGSSMGGYGSVHFSKYLYSSMAVAVGPQLFVNEDVIPEEKRWVQERKKIEFLFDEVSNLKKSSVETIVFFDNFNAPDNLQVERCQSRVPASNVKYIACPYTMHDAVRVLVKDDRFKMFLIDCFSGNFSGFDGVDGFEEHCLSVYAADDKAFLNWARNVQGIKSLSTQDRERLIDIFGCYKGLRFQELFMLAQALLKIGFYKEAVLCSLESMKKYPKPEIPPYMWSKHESVLGVALENL